MTIASFQGFRTGVNEDSVFLVCEIASLDVEFPKFRDSLVVTKRNPEDPVSLD